MQNQPQISLTCSACHQPFNAPVISYLDAAENPQAKAQLLAGRLNSAPCPHCGTVNTVAAPLLYHDPETELLIAYVPMELNLQQNEQERVIGDLMNRMPKDNFKGYMFNPRRALTMQNLVEQILEADGITPEMMEQQRARVRLIQQFVDAPSEDALIALIKEHDSEIDEQFFQTMTMMVQRTAEDGHTEIAQQIAQRHDYVVQNSTYGAEVMRRQEEQQAIIEEVAGALQELGQNASREQILNLAVLYAEDDTRLQALVGIARPAFDYEFFQMLTTKASEAPAESRDSLNALRQRLLELTNAMDQQAQASMQNAARFLQAVIQHENPQELLAANIHLIDDTFMNVLAANIQKAQQENNTQAVEGFTQVYNMVVSLLQSQMQPELRFINELLSAPDDEQATALLQEQIGDYDVDLLEMFDAVEDLLTQQGNQQLLVRLKGLRQQTQALLQ